MGNKRKAIKTVLLFILITATAEAFNFLVDVSYEMAAIGFYCCHILLFGILFYWQASIRKRVVSREAANELTRMTAMMVLWLIIRMFAYRLCTYDMKTHDYAYYLYTIPSVFIPLFSFRAVYRVSGRKNRKLEIIMLCAAALLSLAALTNDLHRLYYIGRRAGSSSGELERGILKYLEYAWIIGVQMSAVTVAIRYCAFTANRKKAKYLLLLLAMVILYIVWNETRPWIIQKRVIHHQESTSLLTIAGWEICIYLQLLPTNRGYDRFFQEGSFAAQIVDLDENVVYEGNNVLPMSKEQKEKAQAGFTMLTEDLRLRSKTIPGGRVYYQEDLSLLHSMERELMDKRQRLSEQIDLLQAENRATEERLRLETQNKLYSDILEKVHPQAEIIQHWAQEIQSGQCKEAEKQLAWIAVAGAYIKRQCNLMLLTSEKRELDGMELNLCLLEVMHALKLCGVQCALSGRLYGSVRGTALSDLFEKFAQIILRQRDLCALRLSLLSEEDAIFLHMEADEKSFSLSALRKGESA